MVSSSSFFISSLKPFWVFTPFIKTFLGLGFVLSNVDNFAHIGGLIGGAMMAMALGVKDKSSMFEKVNGWIIVSVFTVFICYIAFIYSAV